MYLTIGLREDGTLSLYGSRDFCPGLAYIKQAAAEGHYQQILVVCTDGGFREDCRQVARYEYSTEPVLRGVRLL